MAETANEEMREAPAKYPVRMLHVFPSFGFGGQQSRFAVLAVGLGQGFVHDVLALDGDTAASALFPATANVLVRPFAIRKSSFASLSNIKAFKKAFQELKPDILCTYNWGSIEAAIARRSVKDLPHLHFEDGFGPGETPDRQPLRRVLARRFLLKDSTVIAPSKVLEGVAKKTWKLPQVRYIANGIDFERFQNAATKPHAHVTIGSVGALRAEKNYARLIRAFASFERGADAQLMIVGGGPERNALKALTEETSVEDRVSLPGPTNAPEEAYRDFDIFALSSDTEQAPLSLMEAMAAGLPVVSTDVGDIAEMVSKENRPFVTPVGDDGAYRDALERLLKEPGLRAALGAANRRKAKAEFSKDRMLEQHRALYMEAIHG